MDAVATTAAKRQIMLLEYAAALTAKAVWGSGG